jgi:hypothetical protein
MLKNVAASPSKMLITFTNHMQYTEYREYCVVGLYPISQCLPNDGLWTAFSFCGI